MSEGLDVIIVDDDTTVCGVLTDIVERFYTWGRIISFANVDEATQYCLSREVGVAVFVVDVFLGGKSGFYFLDAIEERFPEVHSDTIMITGHANDDVVNMCVASGVNHLLEKPVRPYALQLAIRAMVSKYMQFARRVLQDPDFVENLIAF
jgi:response regulator of citrate/malate metabolism